MSPRQPKAKAEPAKRSFIRRRAAPTAKAPAGPPDLSAAPLEEIQLAGLDPRTLIAPNFRVYELTRSDPASQHASGEACDIEIVGMATLELAAWVRDHLADFDQIICECYDQAKGPNSGWVHVSLKPPGSGANRKQCLSYVRDASSGRLVYVTGLTAMT
jgi:hypothetical protein